jgi:hypothetical protein
MRPSMLNVDEAVFTMPPMKYTVKLSLLLDPRYTSFGVHPRGS